MNYLDNEAQQDLLTLLALEKQKAPKAQLEDADRRVSAWITHGRISPAQRQALITALHDFERRQGWTPKDQ